MFPIAQPFPFLAPDTIESPWRDVINGMSSEYIILRLKVTSPPMAESSSPQSYNIRFSFIWNGIAEVHKGTSLMKY